MFQNHFFYRFHLHNIHHPHPLHPAHHPHIDFTPSTFALFIKPCRNNRKHKRGTQTSQTPKREIKRRPEKMQSWKSNLNGNTLGQELLPFCCDGWVPRQDPGRKSPNQMKRVVWNWMSKSTSQKEICSAGDPAPAPPAKWRKGSIKRTKEKRGGRGWVTENFSAPQLHEVESGTHQRYITDHSQQKHVEVKISNANGK